MEEINIDNGNERMIRVPAIEIIRKLRTKEDRQNFCRENSKPTYIIFRLVCPDERAWVRYIFYFVGNARKKEVRFLLIISIDAYHWDLETDSI